MHHCAELIFNVVYLREYESIFETSLAHKSLDPGVLFDEKNQRPKISWDCPFNKTILQLQGPCSSPVAKMESGNELCVYRALITAYLESWSPTLWNLERSYHTAAIF
jgi:hypothetical protein